MTTPEGVNGELMPIVRMTLAPRREPARPRHRRRRRAASGAAGFSCSGSCRSTGTTWCSSASTRRTASSSARRWPSMRTWEHERTLEPTPGGGCVVRDRVRFEPRLPGPGPCAAAALPDGLPPPPPPAPAPLRGAPRIGGGDRHRRLRAGHRGRRAGRPLRPGQAAAARRRGGRLPPGPGDQRRGGARARAPAATRRCSTTRASCAPTCASCAARTGSGLDTEPVGRRGAAAHRPDLQPRPRRLVRGRDRRRARSSR